jgi:hypothetical protein
VNVLGRACPPDQAGVAALSADPEADDTKQQKTADKQADEQAAEPYEVGTDKALIEI